jgi:hypothetical protein
MDNRGSTLSVKKGVVTRVDQKIEEKVEYTKPEVRDYGDLAELTQGHDHHHHHDATFPLPPPNDRQTPGFSR